MSEDYVLNWEPLVSVGPFKFDTSIQEYVQPYNLHFIEAADETVNWDTYATSDKNVYIDTEDSKIIGVSCYECLFYKQKNLIGLSLSEIREILGTENEIGTQLGGKIPVEYYALSLQLWIQNGCVTNTTCNGFFED